MTTITLPANIHLQFGSLHLTIFNLVTECAKIGNELKSFECVLCSHNLVHQLCKFPHRRINPSI